VQEAREVEVDLIGRCQRGEHGAFDILYDRFGDAVWRLCRRMAGNPTIAEDIAQDVWVTVWQQIGSFRCEAAFRTWLYRIASNACLQWLRKRVNQEASSMQKDCSAPSPTPEAEVCEKENVRGLLTAFGALSDSLRLPLALRVDEGLSYAEIAQILDCSAAAVKTRISRARAALAEATKEETT